MTSERRSTTFFEGRTQVNTKTQNIERRTLNLWPDTGQRLGLSRQSTYAAAKRGDIPTIRIGDRILVTRAALERLLNGAGQ